MEKAINIFEKNKNIFYTIDCAVEYLRKENYHSAMLCMEETSHLFSEILNDLIENKKYFNAEKNLVDPDYILSMMEGILKAQEQKDYVLLADLLEMQMKPYIADLQQFLAGRKPLQLEVLVYERNREILVREQPELEQLLEKAVSLEEMLEKGYSVEYTSSGLCTLAVEKNEHRYYFHSNGNPRQEGRLLAEQWYEEDITEYAVYGMGLAYHICALSELDETITVIVFEQDVNILRLALFNHDLSRFLEQGRIKICLDSNFQQMSQWVGEKHKGSKLLVHSPSMTLIEDLKVKSWLEDYFIQYSSVMNQHRRLNSNFRENIKQYDGYAEELGNLFQGKKLYLVAAGPSLDSNYQELKNKGEDEIILAVGTVYKKLLEAGIRPDYIILTDANPWVYDQIKGREQEDIPLLFLSTAYFKVAQNYSGKRYIILQEGFQRAEEYADTMGKRLFQTGGSVITTALDIGIRLGCRKIVFIGLDLAYTGNWDHASGTPLYRKAKTEGLKQVKDIFGNPVYTTNNLDIYRKWIERRLKEEDCRRVSVIDATEGGARVEGTKIQKLSECMKHS